MKGIDTKARVQESRVKYLQKPSTMGAINFLGFSLSDLSCVEGRADEPADSYKIFRIHNPV